MDGSAQFEVSSSDAGFEEHGVGGEVRSEISAGHEIQGGDCFLDVTNICVADEEMLE